MSAQRKIPMRQCLGCKELKPKKELIRVVKNSEGEVSLDLVGRKPGKGAYICRDVECFKKARKQKSFERSLGVAIPTDVFDMMEAELQNDGQ